MQSDYQIKVKNVKSNCGSITVNILEMNFNTCSGSSLPGSSMPIHIITIDKTILPINFVYLGWDNDADGFTTAEEAAAGTNPCDAASHP